jgi:uncharacterized protein (TIGR02594 family)
MTSSRVIEWFHTNFRTQVVAATTGTPFKPDLFLAIAIKETGYLTARMLKKGMATPDILLSCAGDTIDRNKGRFTDDRLALEAAPQGTQIFQAARDALSLVAPHSTGYASALRNNPDAFCRGFGIFQYDLQFAVNDPNFFIARQWGIFDECLSRCIRELREAMGRNGWNAKADLKEAEEAGLAIAYNCGSYDPARGLKQGHRNGTSGVFYGEEITEILADIRQRKLDWSQQNELAAPQAVQNTHVVIASTLNVRSAPEKGSAVLDSIMRYSVIEETGSSDTDRRWLKVSHGGRTGWLSNKFLIRRELWDYPWIQKACGELGVGEFADDATIADNPRINEYFSSVTGRRPSSHRDETAWCSAFVNWCMEDFAPTGEITRRARSWQSWGTELSQARLGAVVVLWRRPSSREDATQNQWGPDRLQREGSYGHVGFLVDELDGRAVIVGGNQSSNANALGEVNKKEYQLDGRDGGVLTWRWPSF